MNDPVRRVQSIAGFGMVSLLISIVLLTLGVIALSASSSYLTSLHTDAAERTRATSIAVSHMEELKIRPPSSLASESPLRVDETGTPAPAGPFVRTVSVGPEPSVTDAARVVVEVEYPAGFGRRRSVELVTVIFQGGV